MKGNQAVLQDLNTQLSKERDSIRQWKGHAAISENLGLSELASAQNERARQEMKHADMLLDRILFLGGAISVAGGINISLSRDVAGMMTNDGALEAEGIDFLNQAIDRAEDDAGDQDTATLFRKILSEESDHMLWIEQQQDRIALMGLQNYISTQA